MSGLEERTKEKIERYDVNSKFSSLRSSSRCCSHLCLHPGPDRLLFGLFPKIIQHIVSQASAKNQVHQAQAAVVPFTTADQVAFLPSRDAAQDEAAGQGVVSAVGERLFHGHHGQIDVVGEQVEAEQHGGDVGGEEDVDEVGEGVVVVGDQRVGRRHGMLPAAVHVVQPRRRGVQGVAMQKVSQDLWAPPTPPARQ